MDTDCDQPTRSCQKEVWRRSNKGLCGGVMVVCCMKYYSGLGRTSIGLAVKDHWLLRKWKKFAQPFKHQVNLFRYSSRCIRQEPSIYSEYELSSSLAYVFGPQHGDLRTINERRNQSVKCALHLYTYDNFIPKILWPVRQLWSQNSY